MALYGQTPISDDRAAFNVYEQAERQSEASLRQRQDSGSPDSSASSSESEQETTDHTSTLAKVRNASRRIRTKARAKSKKIIHPTSTHQPSQDPSDAPTLAPPPSTETDDDRLYHDPPEHKGIQAKDLLRNPVSTVQGALHGASGGKMAQVVDNQAITHGANVNLVRAHDKVASAQDEGAKQDAVEEVEALDKARQDTYVRWTMDRHVLKVRRIPPQDLPRPSKKDYKEKHIDVGGLGQWAAYRMDVCPLLACQRVRRAASFQSCLVH